MFKTKLLISLLISFIFLSCTRNTLDREITKYSLAYTGGEYDGLILNNLLKETADSGEWQNINKEAETTSVMDNTQNLPDHLANALNKDYSGVMKAVEEKAKFKNGA